MTILLGNGDGTFTAAASLVTGTNPVALTIGDFNKDGKSDIAVSNGGGGSLTIFLGAGDGTFNNTPPPPRLASGTNPGGIATADFNGDGKPDLAVLNVQTHSSVEIFLGNGDGTFTAGVNLSTAEPDARGIAIGEFNGDGKLDLAIIESDASSELAILLGNGDGTFSAAVVIPTPGLNGNYIAVGDFNGDGHADVAIANYWTSSLTVMLGNGDGTFQTAIAPGGEYALTVAIGDFNGDGLPDLAAPNSQTHSVTVLLSTTSGACGSNSVTSLQTGLL